MLNIWCQHVSPYMTDPVLEGKRKQAQADLRWVGLKGIDLAPALQFPLRLWCVCLCDDQCIYWTAHSTYWSAFLFPTVALSGFSTLELDVQYVHKWILKLLLSKKPSQSSTEIVGLWKKSSFFSSPLLSSLIITSALEGSSQCLAN